MKIYIDQSGKIETTNRFTVIAYANGRNKAITISSIEKRKLQQTFRSAGKPEMFIFKTFAILMYLLIKDDLQKITCIVIDREYFGRESLIKKYLIELIRHGGDTFDANDIHFTEIGKKSSAHNAAISVFRKTKKPELVVKYKDVIKWII